MESTYDIAQRLSGVELLQELDTLGVARYHLDTIRASNDVTLARAMYVYVHVEAAQV